MDNFLNTPHKKKSAILTSLIALLLLLLFSWVGLSYFDPPISYGMEVNFGTSNQGKGTVQPKLPPKQIQKQNIQPKTVTPKTSPKATETKTSKVLTQKEASIPVVKKANKPNPNSINKKVKTPDEKIKKEVKKEETPKPTVSKSTKQVLSNLLNPKMKTGKNLQGEGNDEVSGDKGKIDGNPYASSYYGKAGLGGKGSGFGLNGRSLQNQGSVTQKCNQEGTVVVRIIVDKSGSVVEAEPGVKGTTNSDPCLLEPAKRTALLHKWFPDLNAPNNQVGFVVVKFKLGE
ncbi:MAG: energy transducer TonB [Flavobacteriales bacterium]|nr:energy transducer TonB [Candidatus Arcticimaribacter sp.]